MPGVHAVVTARTAQDHSPSRITARPHDQPILAIDKVHYVGEPVAVVLADDPYLAEEAAQLIVAEYDELPAVFDEVEAATSDIHVHEELKPAGTFPDLKHLKGRKGPTRRSTSACAAESRAAALPAAARVRAHVPHAAVPAPGAGAVRSMADARQDRVTVYTASQSPSFVRIEIARLLGWPENRVRVVVPFLGGGFGGKLYIKLEALVVALRC